MNKKQKIVLIIGVITVVVVFIFAPLYMPARGGYIIMDPDSTMGRKLPSDILMREGIVAIVTVAIYIVLKDKNK